MPLVLLSKPVGASGNCVAAEIKAKLRAAATMKILMGSPSSSGLEAGLRLWISSCTPFGKGKKTKGLPKSASPMGCGSRHQQSYGFLRSSMRVGHSDGEHAEHVQTH